MKFKFSSDYVSECAYYMEALSIIAQVTTCMQEPAADVIEDQLRHIAVLPCQSIGTMKFVHKGSYATGPTQWPVMQPAVPLHNRTKEILGCVSGHPVTLPVDRLHNGRPVA